jgi:hypothetical protein
MECFRLGTGGRQKKRILASSFKTHKYLPFSISAMFMFGHIDDLLMYWDDVPDTRKPPDVKIESETVRARIETLPGCYFATQYLKKIGVSFRPDSIQDYWKIIAEHFCLIDWETLDVYWYNPPLSRNHAIEHRTAQYVYARSRPITFQDWLILYHTQGNHPPAPEWILDRPDGGAMDPH